MRVVASLASLDSHRRVLVQKRSVLVGVAFHAGNVAAKSVRDHPRRLRCRPSGRWRAVGVVAVSTLDRPFVHTMFERQLEARANVEMALVTDFALLIGKQVDALRRVMNGEWQLMQLTSPIE